MTPKQEAKFLEYLKSKIKTEPEHAGYINAYIGEVIDEVNHILGEDDAE